MKIMIDLNVALEMLLARTPWEVESKAILALIDAGKVQSLICASSVGTLFYISRRLHDTSRARLAVTQCLEVFAVAAVDLGVLQMAVRNPSKDFEDNVVLAAAVQASCEAVCTRDPSGFQNSPIPVYSPRELLAQFP